MDLFEKLKIKKLMENDHKWEMHRNDDINDDRTMGFTIDDNNKLSIRFHIYLITPFTNIDISIKNHNDKGEHVATSVEKTLYLSKNAKFIRKLNKIRKELLIIEKEKRELKRLKYSIDHLPKSLARELNIDNVLEDQN
tara:strand:+ start:58 stop:471 length:414 start_codon:yes stop_codon:yes gene_type:complete